MDCTCYRCDGEDIYNSRCYDCGATQRPNMRLSPYDERITQGAILEHQTGPIGIVVQDNTNINNTNLTLSTGPATGFIIYWLVFPGEYNGGPERYDLWEQGFEWKNANLFTYICHQDDAERTRLVVWPDSISRLRFGLYLRDVGCGAPLTHMMAIVKSDGRTVLHYGEYDHLPCLANPVGSVVLFQ